MAKSIDLLASAIHDAKNQVFYANAFAAAAEVEHGIGLMPMRNAMERAVSRLSRALVAYRLDGDELPLSISAVSVQGLIEDAVASRNYLYAQSPLSLKMRCDVEGIWPIDRDLVLDAISNALENAARFANTSVFLLAQKDDDYLLIRIEDDGPGYGNINDKIAVTADSSLGLFIGRRIVGLHERHGRRGELRTYNRSAQGGAVFELRLP